MVTGAVAGMTVRVSSLVIVPADESTTLTVKIVVPAIVGVPVMTLDGFIAKPGGKRFDPALRFHV
jgi:hypothetical protein